MVRELELQGYKELANDGNINISRNRCLKNIL